MAFGDVRNRARSASTGTSITLAFGTTPTEGDLLIAVHMTGAASSNSVASGGNNWTSGLACTNATESDEVELWWRIAGASEATSVLATPSASDENALVLFAIEGPWETSPVDVTASPGRQASGATYNCGTTGTTSQNDEVAVAFAYSRSPASVSSPSSWSASFVFNNPDSQIASSNKSVCTGTKLLTATGAVTTTLTWGADPGAPSQGGIVTFKKSGGAPAATELPFLTMAPMRPGGWGRW